MDSLCKFKEKIEEAICQNYCDVENVSGDDLEELGEWIDIVKDIAQIKYYKVHSKWETAYECVIALDERISKELSGMSTQEKANIKAVLTNIIAKLG